MRASKQPRSSLWFAIWRCAFGGGWGGEVGTKALLACFAAAPCKKPVRRLAFLSTWHSSSYQSDSAAAGGNWWGPASFVNLLVAFTASANRSIRQEETGQQFVWWSPLIASGGRQRRLFLRGNFFLWRSWKQTGGLFVWYVCIVLMGIYLHGLHHLGCISSYMYAWPARVEERERGVKEKRGEFSLLQIHGSLSLRFF